MGLLPGVPEHQETSGPRARGQSSSIPRDSRGGDPRTASVLCVCFPCGMKTSVWGWSLDRLRESRHATRLRSLQVGTSALGIEHPSVTFELNGSGIPFALTNALGGLSTGIQCAVGIQSVFQEEQSNGKTQPDSHVPPEFSFLPSAFPPFFFFLTLLLSPPPSLLLFLPYGFTSFLAERNHFDSNRIHPQPTALPETQEEPVS